MTRVMRHALCEIFIAPAWKKVLRFAKSVERQRPVPIRSLLNFRLAIKSLFVNMEGWNFVWWLTWPIGSSGINFSLPAQLWNFSTIPSIAETPILRHHLYGFAHCSARFCDGAKRSGSYGNQRSQVHFGILILELGGKIRPQWSKAISCSNPNGRITY